MYKDLLKLIVALLVRMEDPTEITWSQIVTLSTEVTPFLVVDAPTKLKLMSILNHVGNRAFVTYSDVLYCPLTIADTINVVIEILPYLSAESFPDEKQTITFLLQPSYPNEPRTKDYKVTLDYLAMTRFINDPWIITLLGLVSCNPIAFSTHLKTLEETILATTQGKTLCKKI